MFRKMRRFKQEIDRKDCCKILANERRGVLSVIGDDGYPYAFPVDFYYGEAENCLYFHGAKQGHKIDAINRCDKVCFTVSDKGEIREGDWAPYVTSVIAFGRAVLVDDVKQTCDKLRLIGRKYYPDEAEVEAEMARDAMRAQLIRMEIEHMSGKLVHEK